MSEVRQWLESLGLGEYAESFGRNAIEPELLAELTDGDLRELGVEALGHRKRILKSIAELELTPVPAAPGPAAPVAERPAQGHEAERRQLTVMFCDLVDSTRLSQRLDPEELRDVITAFQDACKVTIEEQGGYLARYMGDGVLAYFGFPHAHEDDAERAVTAGTALVERVTASDGATALEVRVGIATGPVVVGDLIGAGAATEAAVVGETPNLAARLQAEAQPSTVLVSALTESLTRGFFELEDLGARTLKGFDAPQHIWRVAGARAARSRFEALRGHSPSPFVGRRSELGLLLDRWEAATQGEGQVLLVGGEAGVGKSRVTEELLGRTGGDAKHILRYQCAPNQTNTAYFPFIQQLWQAAGLLRDDATEQRLDKLEAFVSDATPHADRAHAVLAALLSLPVTRFSGLGPRPGLEKTDTISALLEVFESLGRDGPMLAVFEDVHWVDPSSHEVLDSMVATTAALPALIVVTHRSTFRSPWRGHGHVTELQLSHLRQSECLRIIHRLCGDRSLPEALNRDILARAGGVPLFVEEITKTVLASGTLVAHGDEYEQASSASHIPIPSTLNDSLMARLDRLGSAREIAQVGACVGREFSHAIVLAVSGAPAEQVDQGLLELEAEQLIFRQGEPPHARYTFKHALIRDAAAGSLLNKDRRRVHVDIAEYLESVPRTREDRPELLAHHYTEADMALEATPCWLRAGEKAARQQAHREAIAQFEKGLELLGQLAEGVERDQMELDLQAMLGSVYMQYTGYGAPEGEQAYTRASTLFDRLALDDPERRFAVLSGLRRAYTHHGQSEQAEMMSRECLRIAERTVEPYMLRDAHYSVATCFAIGGQCADAVAEFELGARHEPLEAFDPAATWSTSGPEASLRDTHLLTYGGIAFNHVHGAHALWSCGYADRARRWCAKVLELERRMEQPYWKSYYLAQAALLSVRLGDLESLRDHAARAHAIAVEHRLALLTGWSRAMLGWLHAMTGDGEVGRAELRDGIAIVGKSGSFVNQPFYETLLAETCLRDELADAGLAAIARAEEMIESQGAREWQVETLRVKACLLRLANPDSPDAAEACLREGIEIARRQQARSPELRATLSLGRLLAEGDRSREARDAVTEIYGWFTEGFDTPDLTEARILMEALGQG